MRHRWHKVLLLIEYNYVYNTKLHQKNFKPSKDNIGLKKTIKNFSSL